MALYTPGPAIASNGEGGEEVEGGCGEGWKSWNALGNQFRTRWVFTRLPLPQPVVFVAVEDYPRDVLELEARFSTETACREYLCRLRWPDGFRCPRCGGRKSWPKSDGLVRCAGCDYQVSVTAGTVFQDSRLPLTLWFRAVWWVTSQKNGVSAMGLQRVLGLKSYKTAWTMLHKLRHAMVRPGRDRLQGRVEVDEAFVGGEEEGVHGRQIETKAMIAVAAEEDGDGIGRIRM